MAEIIYLNASHDGGMIVDFIAGLISLIYIFFGLIDALKQKDKHRAWTNFFVLALAAGFAFIFGNIWFCLLF